MKEFISDNVAGYRPAVLLRKKFFLRHFSRILHIDLVNYRTVILKRRKHFKSEQFQWLLVFISTIS